MDETDKAQDQGQDLSRLRRELRRLPNPPVPAGMLRHLLEIPSGREPRWRRALVPALPVFIAAVVLALIVRQPPPEDDPSVVALQEFRLAMSYVQRGAAVTNEEISDAIETGLREAYGISRGSVLGEDRRSDEGDQDEDY